MNPVLYYNELDKVRPDTKHRSTENTEDTEDGRKHRRRRKTRNGRRKEAQKTEDGRSASLTSEQRRRRLPSELPESVFPAFLREGYIQVLPENTNRKPSNILFVLHGVCDTPASYAELAKRMHLPETLVVALPGPLSIPETGVQARAKKRVTLAFLFFMFIPSLKDWVCTDVYGCLWVRFLPAYRGGENLVPFV